MKKKKINKKVPAYSFGMDPTMLFNVGGSAVSTIGDTMIAKSDPEEDVNVAGSALKGLGTGAAMGAAVGSVIPGIGTAIGGAVGAVAGGITGLFTGSKKKREALEKKRRAETLKQTEEGYAIAAQTELDYWDENTPAMTFENGGILPDLAYVDNNEIIRDDFGNIVKVPNTTSGTDEHLINSTNLDSVLSDKIKRPGTKNTFAKEGEILAKMTKPSKGKDMFAENTNKLNKMNANRLYNSLLEEQESVKAKKGIKPKVKGVPAYEDGKNKTYKVEDYVWPWDPTWSTILRNSSDEVNIQLNPNKRLLHTGASFPALYEEREGGNADNATYGVVSLPNVDVLGKTPSNTQAVSNTTNSNAKTTAKAKNTTKPTITTDLLEAPAIPLFDVPTVAKPTTAPKVSIPTSSIKTRNNTTPNTSGRYIPDLLSLIPTAYNITQALRGPEVDPLITNPYRNSIINTMAKRRMNIDPIRLANSRSRAIANYNLANLNANTGMNLAARTQAAIDEYAANMNLYATKQNADNAYLADYANTLNNLGQQWEASVVRQNEANARNRAAARNFGATAASQAGKWAQVNRQMRNQYNRDRMLLPYLQEYLDAVTNTSKYNRLIA